MVLSGLLAAASADPLISTYLNTSPGVCCHRLLPLVEKHLRKSTEYQQAIEDITDTNVQGCLPDATRVAEARAAGGHLFKSGDYDKSLQQYNEALRWLDETTPQGRAEAAVLHCNRSLCLLKTSPVQACAALNEADAAVTADHSSYKGLYRRACAHMALGQLAAAQSDLLSCIALLEKQQQKQQKQQPCVPTTSSQAVASGLEDVRQLLAQVQAQLLGAKGAPMTAQDVPAQVTGNTQPHICSASSMQLPTSCESTQGQTSGAALRSPPSLRSPHTSHTPESPSSPLQPHALPLEQQNPANSYISQLSHGRACVATTLEAGRQLQAACALSLGTDVLMERPIASVLRKAQRKDRCWHCTRKVDGPPLYCLACPMVQYCSTSCRAQDVYHKPGGVECRRPWARVVPENMLLATRLARAITHPSSPPLPSVAMSTTTTTTITDLDVDHSTAKATPADHPLHRNSSDQLLISTAYTPQGASMSNLSTTPASMSQPFQPSQPPVNILMDLVTHIESPREASLALERCVCAVLASDALLRASRDTGSQTLDTTGPALDTEHRQTLDRGGRAAAGQDGRCGMSQLTVMCVLECLLRVDLNAVALQPVASGRGGERQWAVGLYPGLATSNHSCSPGMTIRFVNGDTVISRLTCNVTPGAPLTISYGPQQGEHLTPDRQAHLKDRYFFTCHCPVCTSPSGPEQLWGPYRAALACVREGCPGGIVDVDGVAPQREGVGVMGHRDASRRVNSFVCDVCGCEMPETAGLQARGVWCEVKTACEALQDVVAMDGCRHLGAEELRRFVLVFERARLCMHAGNLNVGQLAHEAGEAVGQILDKLRGAGDDRLEEARWCAEVCVALYQQSLDTLQLHYPIDSVQVAFEQLRLVMALRRLCKDSLSGMGPGAVVVPSNSQKAGLEQRAGSGGVGAWMHARALKLEAGAWLVLWRHFGEVLV